MRPSINPVGYPAVLGHDGDALGVDGAQVGVLEEPHQVGLARLLQRHDGRALEAQVGLEVLRDLAHQPLERQLADQQLGGLLVAPDLAQGHRAGPVAVRLLHAARSQLLNSAREAEVHQKCQLTKANGCLWTHTT